MIVVVVTEVVGDVVVAERFRKFGLRALEAEPAFEEIAVMMRDAERELFATEGSSGGDPWEQLSDETLRTKEQKGFPPDIEIATGALMESLTEAGHEDHVEEIGPDFLRFGTTNEAAGPQQKGTSKHDMPARKVLKFRDDQIEGFTWAIYTYITKGAVDSSMFAL